MSKIKCVQTSNTAVILLYYVYYNDKSTESIVGFLNTAVSLLSAWMLLVCFWR